ncbi:MAG TPA: LysR substrate-binding domain-containing protein [Gammaproteobacteria bacterium]|nr:LysR substrate-binding domain-containing protein [Gammaproteobacteria bacterium]
MESLKLFAEVARRGSFATVARHHNLDPSTVSRLMAALETELGARLFQRSTRRVALTEAGELFLAKVEPLVAELEGALDEARKVSAEPAGTLRLTASVTFGQLCIVPLLPEFRRRHPGVKLDCVFTDENLDLVANRIDLAVRLAPTVEGDLVASRLMDTPYRVVASPTYLKSAPPLRSPADLAGHPCLLPPYQVFRPNWLFKDAQGRVTEVPVRGDVTLSTFTALRDLTVLGLGPCLLPYWLVAGLLRDGALVDLFTDYAVTATTFDAAAWLVYPSRAYLPNKVRVMVDFLKQRFAT